MRPLSNSLYSSVFMYNLYVLTRPYWHLTFVALIEPHCITSISLLLAFWLWNLDTKYACAKWIPLQAVRNELRCRLEQNLLMDCLMTKHQTIDYKYSLPFITVWILCFICGFTSSNSYTVTMPYSWCTKLMSVNTYACDSTFCHII